METPNTPARPHYADQQAETREFARQAAQTAAESRIENVLVLDLRGLSSVADYFVIGTGSSDRQMRAVLAYIEELALERNRRPFRIADSRDSRWLLADYVDVVVHLFDAEHRDFYDLEGLWGDAPRLAWESEASTAGPGSAENADIPDALSPHSC